MQKGTVTLTDWMGVMPLSFSSACLVKNFLSGLIAKGYETELSKNDFESELVKIL